MDAERKVRRREVSRAERDFIQMHRGLRRIRDYMNPEQLRRKAEKIYGLPYEEALEMAYENLLREAKDALKVVRVPKPQEAQHGR